MTPPLMKQRSAVVVGVVVGVVVVAGFVVAVLAEVLVVGVVVGVVVVAGFVAAPHRQSHDHSY